MNLILRLPFEALFVLYTLQKTGLDAYIVGGAVRDLLIEAMLSLQKPSAQKYKAIADYDFTTNAHPEKIQTLFKDSYYENEFGMVGVAYEHLLEQIQKLGITLPPQNLQLAINQSLDSDSNSIIDLLSAKKIHKSLIENPDQVKTKISDISNPKKILEPHPFEITTYRSDGIYKDFRRPEKVVWGKSIQDDVERRDFSINAMAIRVNQNYLTDIFEGKNMVKSNYSISANDYELIDQHNGLKDLTEKTIKTVGDPDVRFQEDALRMLRAIRFSVQMKMKIDQDTLEAIHKNYRLIQHISWERIRDEFLKMLASDQPRKAIELLDDTSLLDHILPELSAGRGIQQGGHHTTDVWTHSIDALENCPSQDPIVRLATLLHDIGKPSTYHQQNGKITFYNHEIVSSRIASRIARKLRFSKKQHDRLFTLVRFHMFYYQPHHTDAAIRRFMRKVGLENIDDILALREGDRLGSGARKTSWRLEEMKQRMIEQLNQPLDVSDLAVNGHDLINKFYLKPGPILGTTLKQLLEMVLDNPKLNTKEKLLAEAEKIINAE